MNNFKKIIALSFLALTANVSAGGFNTVRVNADILNIRDNGSINSVVIGRTKKDSILHTIGENDDWFQVKLGSKNGWVSKKHLEVVYETVPGKVSASLLNMRKSPGIDGEVSAKLHKYADLEILGKSGDWYKVAYDGNIGYVFRKYVEIMDTPKLPRKDIYSVIEFAKTKLGSQYVWGANGPDKFDCSGYVKYVFENTIGVNLPRTSYLQSRLENKLDFSQLKAGDLVFFDTAREGRVNHVGIYIGDGKFIHASSAKSKQSVTISNLSKFYKTTFKWGVRI